MCWQRSWKAWGAVFARNQTRLGFLEGQLMRHLGLELLYLAVYLSENQMISLPCLGGQLPSLALVS